MAYYRTKYYGVEASVDAVNRDSADKQLEWLLKGNPCFCRDCRERYYKDYSIRLIDGYELVSTCKSVQFLQNLQGYNQTRLV